MSIRKWTTSSCLLSLAEDDQRLSRGMDRHSQSLRSRQEDTEAIALVDLDLLLFLADLLSLQQVGGLGLAASHAQTVIPFEVL